MGDVAENLTNLRQVGSKMEGRRLCWALVASVSVHAALLLSALPVIARFDHHMVNAAPFSLDVRIAAAPQPVQAPREVPPPKRTVARKVTSPLAESREVEASAPAPDPVLPDEAPIKPLVEGQEQLDGSVSVAADPYSGPLPRRLEGDWTGGEFLREKDLDRPAQAIQLAVPQYPPAALAVGTTGFILVALLVDETGRVVAAEALDTSEELLEYRDLVAGSLLQSTFLPALREGQPVKGMVFQRVHFALRVTQPEPARRNREQVTGKR